MRLKSAVIVFSAAVFVLMASVVSYTQAPATGKKTIWDGVYTDAQAAAGKVIYESECSACHGMDLGGGKARTLKGEAFFRDWSADTVGRLYTRVKTLMPRTAPGSLSDEAYLNVVAHIFKTNEFPVGQEPLTADRVDAIQIVGKGGVEDVPNFALVEVVGCLSQRADKSWVVTRASKPVMTRDPAASKDVAAVDAKPLGDQTFVVEDIYPNPVAQKDRKVEAKGFLMRMPDQNNKISATSVQAVGASCGQ